MEIIEIVLFFQLDKEELIYNKRHRTPFKEYLTDNLRRLYNASVRFISWLNDKRSNDNMDGNISQEKLPLYIIGKFCPQIIIFRMRFWLVLIHP